MKQNIYAVIFSLMLLVTGELHANPRDCDQMDETTLSNLTSSLQQSLEIALKCEGLNDNLHLTRGGLASKIDETLSHYITNFADKMGLTLHQRKFLSSAFDEALARALKSIVGIEISYPIQPSTLIKSGCKAVLEKYLDDKVGKILRIFILSCYNNLEESMS
jgi:hypothetical protein